MCINKYINKLYFYCVRKSLIKVKIYSVLFLEFNLSKVFIFQFYIISLLLIPEIVAIAIFLFDIWYLLLKGHIRRVSGTLYTLLNCMNKQSLKGGYYHEYTITSRS